MPTMPTTCSGKDCAAKMPRYRHSQRSCQSAELVDCVRFPFRSLEAFSTDFWREIVTSIFTEQVVNTIKVSIVLTTVRIILASFKETFILFSQWRFFHIIK